MTNGKQIMIVYYEDLVKKDNLEPSIKNIVTFMNFTIHDERLKCVSKHRKGRFYHDGKCIPKTQKQVCGDEFVYSKKQIKWINSAIRKVNIKIRERGFDDLHLKTYENTNVKLKFCEDDENCKNDS